MNSLRLNIQPGSENYLPFAKKKLGQLKERLAADSFSLCNQRIIVDDDKETEIFVQSAAGIDYIRITQKSETLKKRLFLIYVSGNSQGVITGINPTANHSGANYHVGDILTIVDDYGKNGTIKVLAVDSSGHVSTVALNTAGVRYTKGIKLTTGGAGYGCKIEITSATELDPYYELLYLPPPNGIGGDYRVLVYSFDDDFEELKPAGSVLEGLHISDTGTGLNVQSGQDVYYAVLANIYTYNETIDNAEFMDTGWNSTVLIFGANRIVGNSYDYTLAKKEVAIGDTIVIKYIPDKANMIKTGSPSRHWYVLGPDGYVEQCMFFRKQQLLGTGVINQELSLIPEQYHRLWKHEIGYRATPESPVSTGALIGSDYQIGTLGADSSDYQWKLHYILAAIDKDTALVKTVENNWTKGGSKPYSFTINLTVTNRWYTDPGGQWYWTTDTYIYNGTTYIEDDEVVRTEILKIGGIEIENLTYTESRYMQGEALAPFVWIPGGWPGMTLVSHTGDAHGGYYDGVESAGGSISSIVPKYNASLVVYQLPNPHDGRRSDAHWESITIGTKGEFKKSGERDLHVLTFDTSPGYDGLNAGGGSPLNAGGGSPLRNFIIFYVKSKVNYLNLLETPNVTDDRQAVPIRQTIDDPVQTTYYMAYRTGGGALIKTDLGNDIRVASCQINGKDMVYTYAVFKSDKFSHRIVGHININDGTRKEVTLKDDDTRLNNFKHLHHAAIGVAGGS